MKTILPKRLASALLGLVALGVVSSAMAQDVPAEKPALDPFVVLIEKPKKKKAVVRPRTISAPRPTRPSVPPLKITPVTFMTANDESIAVIEYTGSRGGTQQFIVKAGWDGRDEKEFDGRFKVVEVDIDRLVVYDTLAKGRRTIQDPTMAALSSGGDSIGLEGFKVED